MAENNDYLNILYSPSFKCNYSCDYCYRKLEPSDNYEATIENIDNMILHLSDYKINAFILLGGEPSIYKNCIYLIKKVTTVLNPKTFIIMSNGSNLNFFTQLYTLNYNNIKLTISSHLKYYIKNKQIYINLNKLFKNIIYKIIFDKNNYDIMCNFIEDAKIYNFKYNIQMPTIKNKLYIENIDYNYYDEQLKNDLIKKYNIDVIKAINYSNYHIKMFNNKKCYNNTLKINPSGKTMYDSCHYIYNDELKNIYYNKLYRKKHCIICKNNLKYKYNICENNFYNEE